MQARLRPRVCATRIVFPRFPARAVLVGLACVASLATAACHAEVKVKASTDDTSSDPPRSPEPAPTATAAPVTAAPAAPSTPPADACPLLCYEARGSVRGEMTADENTQLRSSLEPVLGRMRQCTSPDDWRRHGSATINLRIAPDGTLAGLGVDPHHGSASSCFEDAGRSSGASVSLPGRKVVRCAERCVRESPRRRNARQ